MIVATCLLALSAQGANTWWVDTTNGVDAVGYGTSSSLAFKTLQYAHDKAASGDTIKVLPGVYADTSPDENYGKARLHLYNKKLYIKAVGGPDVTIIKGAFAPGTEYGYGADGGVRCITCRGDEAAKSVIEGFTLRDGAASATTGATALQSGAKIIGINNRNLKDFTVALNTCLQLRAEIPADRICIAESGIRDAEDIRRLRAARFNGVLIGETLMRSGNPEKMLRKLREA